MNEQMPLKTKPFVDDTKIPIEEKEKVIQRKKAVFITTVVIAALVIIIPLLGFGAYKAYIAFIRVVNVPIIKQTEEPTKNNNQNTNTNTETVVLNEYSSDNLRIKLSYLSDAKVVDAPEVNGESRKLLVLYSKDNTNKDEWTIDNISTGYIFKIATFDTQVRNLDDVAAVKQESYKTICASTAVFSKITETTLNLEKARTFSIQNCNGDYVITYVLKFNTFYEITQIFRGDLGYRQLYQSTSGDIYNSLKFYSENIGELGPTETYTDKEHGFSFQHPHLDAACCELPIPTLRNPEKIVSLGDRYTYVDSNNFDGIGIWTLSLNTQSTYKDFVNNSRKTLVDDYKVVRGVPPKTQDIDVKVGSINGIMLRGYTWQGNDLIYVEVPKQDNRSYVLIISVKNKSGDAFTKTVDDILKSFTFTL
jgi:hypothetical protein